jgi:hypothetical protein
LAAALSARSTGTGPVFHAWTHIEGLRLDPPRDNGRHCMDTDEMADAGMELDARGRWSIVGDAERIRAWQSERAA